MPRFLKGTPLTQLKKLAADRRANFGVMMALSAPIAIALAVVAVDEGALYSERRSAQGLVDIAAITAAANIDKADTAVLLTLRDNGFHSAEIDSTGSAKPKPDRALVSVKRGRYSATSPLGSRFKPDATPFNAVQVSLRKIGSLYFGSALMAPPVIGTMATASASTAATFSIGSGLVKVDTASSPILNAILGGLLGTSLSLSAMDYKALASADVNVLSFVDSLATRLSLTGVSYDQVLSSDISIGQVASAMADVPGLGGGAKFALDTLASKASGKIKVPLDRLLDLGPLGRLGVGQGTDGLTVNANALAMLAAAAAVANGKQQVQLNLGATIPGLASTTVEIAIGEPEQHSPWLAVGETGTVVRTAQTRIRIVAGVGGLGSLLGKVITLPLYLDIAYAEGKLSEISCPTGRVESVRVGVDAKPGVADLRIADVGSAAMRDFSKEPAFSLAKLVDVSVLGLGLVSVSGQARVAIENTTATRLNFSYADINDRIVRSTSTYGLTGSLAGSLLGSLQLEAHVLGLRIGVPPGITSALGTTLAAATDPLDALLDNLLALLGIKVGNADIRATGATCSRSVLVQ